MDRVLYKFKVADSPNAEIVNTDINNQFRNDLQKNINTMLGTMFGRDKVNVSVFSTMNFDQKKSKEQLVRAPNQVDQKGIEISLQEASESYQNNGTDTGGVPGTGSTDVPGYPGASNSGKSIQRKIIRLSITKSIELQTILSQRLML